jgi:tetraacyldisaccharide 4'-kinase
MREPSFWWREAGVAARLLAPFAAAYGMMAAHRLQRRGDVAGVPVVCVGNPTVGGAGKTPTALTLARILMDAGERPFFLTRGYGGDLPGPVLVDPAKHRAADVGDEPLLLARAAPTIVARARVAGAAAAVTSGATVIVMDDGFQNPALAKDFSLLVVDAGRGIGNGMVTPAGPLRAPLAAQLDRAHALLIIGTATGAAGIAAAAQARRMPIFHAQLEPDAETLAALGGVPVLAFAGIGNPEKFFATLSGAGIAIAATRSFDDHHRFTRAEAAALCEQAERQGQMLVTTEKDLARMRGDDDIARLAERVRALPVTLKFEDEAAFCSLMFHRLAAARATRGVA